MDTERRIFISFDEVTEQAERLGDETYGKYNERMPEIIGKAKSNVCSPYKGSEFSKTHKINGNPKHIPQQQCWASVMKGEKLYAK